MLKNRATADRPEVINTHAASLVIGAVILIMAPAAFAHPGRTDSSGCHTCRTNCPRWGLEPGQYHCHGSGRSSARSSPTQRLPPPPPATITLLKESDLSTGDKLPENSIVVPGDRSRSRGSEVKVEALTVVDGDTFVAREGERIYLLKLRDVEAPELEQVHGPEARERLTQWVVGRRIWVWPEKASGCVIPVRAETLSGTEISEQLLSEGFVWASPSAPDALRRLETAARLKEIGLWRGEKQHPPWKYRAQRTMARKP